MAAEIGGHADRQSKIDFLRLTHMSAPPRNPLPEDWPDCPPAFVDPAFAHTRASHVVLTVRDLAASRQFYQEVIGLILTAEEGDTLYFRGVEEACTIAWCCARPGRLVHADWDSRVPKMISNSSRRSSKPRAVRLRWADVPHQGRTLHATDPAGTPLEFCATMPVMPRMITKFTRHAGGSALRLDHYQILTPDVRKTCEFYMAAGLSPERIYRAGRHIRPARRVPAAQGQPA